jgi:2-phospho-L-lactate transferase/gluconeogenesis factor (CofD/UPF0052 family)
MSTSRATLPRRSRSNRAIVVLGRGRGLAVVLQALRDEPLDLTVIVRIAYEEGQAEQARQQVRAGAVEDLRRSLEALAGEEGALLRAIRRPLSLGRLGRRPLGNLVLGSVASALGDYSAASMWLGEQLGVAGTVLPATTQPLPRFTSEGVVTPAPAIAAIEQAKWVLLSPGSLDDGVLSMAALPDLGAALVRSRARVLWIANLEPGLGETAKMSTTDQIRALELHGVRVDAVLHDPLAPLRLDARELEAHGVRSIARALRRGGDSTVHDPRLLRGALQDLIGPRRSAAARALPAT